MKKIFTKLFLLATLLMVSSELWAQDYWSVLNDPAPRTIGWGEEQTFSFNLVGPAEWIRFELDSYGSMDLTVYGYRESNPAARVPIIEVSRAEEGVFQYDIKGQGFSRIEIKVKARGGTAKLLNVMAGSPFYTYESDLGSAEYNSADASTSFTIDYYGTPNFTSTYLYDDWDNDMFPVSISASGGKATVTVKYLHNEVGEDHKAFIIISNGVFKHPYKFTGTTTKANQTITWTPPTELTVGDSHTLSATAPGGAVSYAVTGDAVTRSGNTLTAVKAGTVTITASQAGNSNYNAAASVTKTITIKKATPTVSAWPTIAPVTYGTNLGAALVLKGGSASVAGTFVITDAYTAATKPNAGAHTYSVEFRPTESNKYNNVSGGTATLTVNKANQTIAWTATPPTEMTVGDTHTLSATATSGDAVAFAISGDAATLAGNTLTAVKAGTVTITASQAGNGNYNAAASVTKTITVNKATPTVSAWPTLNAVTYGAKLEQALVLVGGTASVAGTFVITDSYNAATVPNAGAHTYSVEFRPTESNKYNNVSGGTATLTVNKADQVIAWTATPPTEMTVGDSHTLSATALGGTVTFAITGDAATLAENTLTAVQAGTVTITASQAGNGNYNAAANVTHTITINKATPTVTAWPTLNAVTYGAKLEQALVLVGGEASVAGTFVITDAYTAATVPNAGAHTYSVEFRPTESNKYNNVSGGTATLTVNKADQVIAWTATPPTEMTVGDSHTLSATALGGTVTFAITGDAAKLADNTLTAVQAGTVTITASQAGNGNYNPATNVTHTITINKATPTVTAWPTLDAVTYGATLEQALELVGGEASVAGTFAITDSYNAADVPNAGAHTYGVEFRPTESNKYNNVSGGTATLTVNKADQVIAWTATPPTEMTVGDSHTLSATALGGAVAFAITGDAAKLADNTLTAVQAGTVTITASQAGNGNYNAAANVTHTITINKATPTVTAWPTLNAVTYDATLEQALVLVGGTASVEGTFVITDSYNAADVPNAGTHTYSVEFRPTESNKYNNVSGGTATLTVNKAEQVIAWTATPPTEMTVGDSHTLSATALGGAVAFAITGDAATLADNTLTAVQAGTVTITASQAGNSNYNAAANITHTITINKATPTVTAWPTIAAVTYGATLEQALVLVGGTVSVEGTFVITDAYTAATVPNAGAHTYNLEFRPTESNKYNNVSGGTATLTVNKANQAITWTATPPTEMTVGDSHTLSATALGGAVAFAITGDAATLADNTLTAVQAGTVTITASQAGNSNYNAAANVTHTITINKATPTVTAWPTLNAVTYGATLEQALVLVDGTASVEGTFVITDTYTAATVPNAGAHTYNLEFRPTESNKYNNVSGGTATLTINQASPSVTWPTFAEVTYGTTLRDALQLVGGNANVEGAFHISGEYNEEEVPVVGTYKYAVWFNPTDYTNYTSLYKDDVTLTVNKANQTITWDFADCTLLPGQTLELNATATCGAMTYLVSGAAISVSGTTLTAVAEGTASIKATHAGNENYNAIESPEYTITVSASGYTRTVTNGDYGTICLPYGSSNYSGAEFYEIAYAEIKNGDAIGLYLDQIEEGAALVAGKPYIFKATADILIVTYEGAIVDAPVAGDAGLTGTLVDIPANDVLVGNYIIAQNMFWDASAENYLNANHAYINKTILLQTEPKSLVPGRRRVSMGETSGNVATDVENSQLPMINSQKLIENGQLIIIRDGVKYNAHGQKL